MAHFHVTKPIRDTFLNLGYVSFAALTLVGGMELATGRTQNELLIAVWSLAAGIFTLFSLRSKSTLGAVIGSAVLSGSAYYGLHALAANEGKSIVYGIVLTTLAVGAFFQFFTRNEA